MPNIQPNVDTIHYEEEQTLERQSIDLTEDIILPESEVKKYSKIDSNIFTIDYTNRLIRSVPGTNIATSTRKFLKLRPEFLLSGVLECDATVTTIDGDPGTEATLNSYTIPLNTISRNYGGSGTSGRDFRKAGNAFRIRAAGVYSTDDALANFTLRLKVGSTVYHAMNSTATAITNGPWILDWFFIISAIGSSGTAESYVTGKINNVNKDTGQSATIAIDTTGALAITITGEWASSNAADSVSIRQFLVELVN